jgi:hypothetical protein
MRRLPGDSRWRSQNFFLSIARLFIRYKRRYNEMVRQIRFSS